MLCCFMVWPSSAQGNRPYERDACPNQIGESFRRTSLPLLFFSSCRSPFVYPERSRGVTRLSRAESRGHFLSLAARCRPINVPLFSHGKPSLSRFSSYRYSTIFFTTRRDTPLSADFLPRQWPPLIPLTPLLPSLCALFRAMDSLQLLTS